jgi:hypothetical protein
MTPAEYERAKKDLTRHRVMANFDMKHHELGGMRKLRQMIDDAQTCEEIATYFGLSTSRIVIIVSQILGMTYSEYLVKQKVRRPGVWRNVSDKRRGPKPKGAVNEQLSTKNEAPQNGAV